MGRLRTQQSILIEEDTMQCRCIQLDKPQKILLTVRSKAQNHSPTSFQTQTLLDPHRVLYQFKLSDEKRNDPKRPLHILNPPLKQCIQLSLFFLLTYFATVPGSYYMVCRVWCRIYGNQNFDGCGEFHISSYTTAMGSRAPCRR